MNKSNITLLIKNNQDLIFKSKNSFVIGKQKQKEKQLNNSFSSNSVKSQLTLESWHLCPDTSTEIGYYVKNATSSVGSEGTVQIPTKNTGVGNAATADSDFGSEIGCIGLYTLGNPTLVIKYSSSGWQGIIFGSSGNPTQYQF